MRGVPSELVSGVSPRKLAPLSRVAILNEPLSVERLQFSVDLRGPQGRLTHKIEILGARRRASGASLRHLMSRETPA